MSIKYMYATYFPTLPCFSFIACLCSSPLQLFLRTLPLFLFLLHTLPFLLLHTLFFFFASHPVFLHFYTLFFFLVFTLFLSSLSSHPLFIVSTPCFSSPSSPHLFSLPTSPHLVFALLRTVFLLRTLSFFFSTPCFSSPSHPVFFILHIMSSCSFHTLPFFSFTPFLSSPSHLVFLLSLRTLSFHFFLRCVSNECCQLTCPRKTVQTWRGISFSFGRVPIVTQTLTHSRVRDRTPCDNEFCKGRQAPPAGTPVKKVDQRMRKKPHRF